MINFWNATCNIFRNKSRRCSRHKLHNCARFKTAHFSFNSRARSAKRNIKCAKLNVYSLRVLCKFVFVVKSAFLSERIYLSCAKDPSARFACVTGKIDLTVMLMSEFVSMRAEKLITSAGGMRCRLRPLDLQVHLLQTKLVPKLRKSSWFYLCPRDYIMIFFIP